MKIKIIVASHKDYWFPNDDVYLPLQVGGTNHEKIGITSDNTGDNISVRNPYYCELTGLYWAWKNLDYDYLGLCHYRRYFSRTCFAFTLKSKKSVLLNLKDYQNLLEIYDVLVPLKRHYYIDTVRGQYEHAHYKEDLLLLEKLLKQLYPEYMPAFYKVMESTSMYRLNMFVMSKTLVNQYCSWLFSILFELEKELDFKKYDIYQARVMGFLGERLFNVWLIKQNLNIKEVPVINLESVNWFRKIYKFLARKYFR